MVISGQAEILRAHQIDQKYIREFRSSFTDISLQFLGVRRWLKFKYILEKFPQLLYYGLTTLSNKQTVGEEYIGILQHHSSGKRLQPKYVQLIQVFLSVFGKDIFTTLLVQFEKYINNLPEDNPLQTHAREKLIQLCTTIRNQIPLYMSIHNMIFYFTGVYYELSKRLTSTRYMLVRPWLKDRSTKTAMQVLGVITLAHTCLNAYAEYMKLRHSSKKETESDNIVNTGQNPSRNPNRCPLCLSAISYTSVIPCGHMFCWNCIISWLEEQPECPVCRALTQPSRVVFIRNY